MGNEMHESFLDLLRDPSHWAFEITVNLTLDGLIGVILWPRIRKAVVHYKKCNKEK